MDVQKCSTPVPAILRSGKLTAIPATETILSYFVTQLAREGLKHRSIKAYLSAVRFLQISEGKGDPFVLPLHRLHYILQGVKRQEVRQGAGKRERLPVSPNILRKMKAVWQAGSENQDTKMLWVAACLGIFGFLRSGEMTVPSDVAFDPDTHLTPKDVSVDCPCKPTTMKVTIKASKTDPFRRGVDIFMRKTDTDFVSCHGNATLLVREGGGGQARCLFSRMDASLPGSA